MEFQFEGKAANTVEGFLNEVVLDVKDLLVAFASSDQFNSVLATSFGNDYDQEDVARLRSEFLSGDFLDEIEIEVLPSQTLQGALGAYASENNTIYLSQDLLDSSPQQASSVLLEEIGHAIDDHLNLRDSAGDEGAIFSSLVQGETLSEEALTSLQQEDDSATFEINGELITVEQAEFTVTTIEDGNVSGTLRSAIALANGTSGADTITFDPSLAGETIILREGQLPTINDPLTIQGLDTGGITIDAQGNGRVFEIDDGESSNDIEVSIDRLTITGGSVEADGGGILNHEALSLSNSTISNNSASSDGGGVFNNYGTVNLSNSTLSGNSAFASGGGLFNFEGTLNLSNSTISSNSADSGGGLDNAGTGAGTVNLTHSTVSGNSASFDGGGISNFAGTVTLRHSTVSGNSGNYGGGILNSGTFGVNSSTIYSNSTYEGGGGISNYGFLNMTNSTVSGNFNSIFGSGGIFNSGSSATSSLTNSTIVDNEAGPYGSGAGGGISNYGSSTLTITNSIFANNVGGDDLSNSGTLNTNGVNLIESVTFDDENVSDIISGDPNLSPLEDNGGSTLTHLPLEGSLVIDAGDNSIISDDLEFDQRGEGFDRVVNGTVDIGAVEFQTNEEKTPPSDPFTVTNVDDSGEGSLRSAIAAANSTSGEDTITFDSSLSGKTITLTSGELEITDDLILEGLGANALTIDADGNSRVLFVNDGDETNLISVSIADVTITGGSSSVDGGGILNIEDLTVTDSVISGNTADAGGGIAHNNTNTGTLTVLNSTITENSSNYGGGIANSGIANVSNSTISGNSASSIGGGIGNYETAEITNSTISGNSSTYGGGISNTQLLTINQSTIFDNSAENAGSGIVNTASDEYDFTGELNLTNSIIANPLGAADIDNVEGTINTEGNNLVEDGSIEGVITGSPNLSPLEDNGGKTLTHLPLEGSPVIDAGDNSVVSDDLEFDQREQGFDRIVNGTVDLGALEVQTKTINFSIDPAEGSEADQTTFTLTATASEAVSGEQTVELALSGGADAEDFVGEPPSTINIADGETTGSVEVTVNNDEVVEEDETATFTISNPSNGLVLGDTVEASAAIADNDDDPINIQGEWQYISSEDFLFESGVGFSSGAPAFAIPVDITQTGNNLQLSEFFLNSAGEGNGSITENNLTATLPLEFDSGATGTGELSGTVNAEGTEIEGEIFFSSESLDSTATIPFTLLSQAPPGGDDEITGDEGNNVLAARSGNDTLRGLGGDDFLFDSSGNDKFIGGTGQDTVLYGGTFSDYNLILEGEGFTIEDLRNVDNNEGTDTLEGIEELLFTESDETIILNPVELSIDPIEGSEADQTTFTLTATASEAVSGEQTVELALSGGADAEDFVGELPSTITLADGETTGSVEVTVNNDEVVEEDETATFTISNPSNGLVLGDTVEASAAIADNDNNNRLPDITSPSEVEIEENTLSVLTITANDPDGDEVSLSLTGGTDQELFSIDESNQLNFVEAPNFDNPQDANEDNVYEVQVEADDGNGGTATETLNISVSNSNEAPVAENDTATTDENTVLNVNTSNGLLGNDSDPDSDSLTISAVEGEEANVGAEFELNSGALLTLNADGSYKYDPNGAFSNLNDEETATESFTYTVSDGNGSTDTAEVTFTLEPINAPPEPTQDFQLLSTTGSGGVNPFSLIELQRDPPAEELIGETTFNTGLDVDPTSGVLYGAGDTLRTINPETGASESIASIETSDESSLLLSSIAFAPDGTLYGTANSESGSELYTINPNTGLASLVGEIPQPTWGIDFSPNGTLYGAFGSFLEINPNTGEVVETIGNLEDTFILDIDLASDGFIYGVEQDDTDDTGILHRIDPSDASTNVIGEYDSQTWGIASLENDNDNSSPEITSPSDVAIDENTLSVLTITANDPDGDEVSLSLTGGEDQQLFSIDESNQLSFVEAPNFDNPQDANEDNVYEVQVEADDGNGGTATQNLQVTINSVNDDIPTVQTPINDLTLTQGQIPDPINLFDVFEDNQDTDEELTYSITEQTNSDLIQANLNEGEGELTFVIFSGSGSSDITVEATDTDGLSVEETFTITVNAPNTAPEVTNPLNDREVETGRNLPVTVNLFDTFEDNQDSDSELQFSASSSNPSLVNADSINTNSGELFLQFPSSSTGSSEITVNAVDSSGLTTSTTFTVNVIPSGETQTFEEPNDTLETASTLQLTDTPNLNLAGEIGDNDFGNQDIDLYRFDLGEGDQLTADINTDDTSSLDSVLRLFDSFGQEIERNDDNQGETDSLLEFSADTPQTYYLGVSGFGNANYNPSQENSGSKGSTGTYNLALTRTSTESEDPNDTIPQAIDATTLLAEDGQFQQRGFLGDNTTLSNPNLDVDLYQIQLQQGETASIDIDTTENSPLNPILRIFNATGGNVPNGFNDNGSAPDENPNNDPYLEFSAPFSGTYYVGVSDQANDLYSPYNPESGQKPGATGAYEINISQDIPREDTPTEASPNDTLDTATSLEVGNEIQGTIGDRNEFITVPGLDVDLYTLSLEADQAININANPTSSLDPILRLFNADGEEIAFNDDIGDSNNARIDFRVPDNGDYFLGVSGFGNRNYNPTQEGSGAPFASTGSYQLTVTEPDSPDLEAGDEENNDTLDTATATGLTPDNLGSLKASNAIGNNPDLAEAGLDVDLLEIELDSNTRLSADINTANLDSELDSLIRLFNSNGESVAFNDDENNDTNDSFLEFVPTEAGTYYLGVSGLGNESYDPTTVESGQAGLTGEYELELSLSETIPPEDPSNDTLDTAINAELNNNRFQDNSFIGDNPNTEGDVDLYQVQLNAEETLNIDINAAPLDSELDGFLRLFDSEGNPLARDDDSGDLSDPQLSFTVPEDNTYYVGVSAFANREYDPTNAENTNPGSTGNYELTLERQTPPAAAQAEEIRPTANNDTGVTNSNNAITLDVLNNDRANDENGFLEITDLPETTEKGGTLELDNNGRLVYTPNPDFAGTDTFTYTASNESGGSAQGTVEVTVNRAPEDANVNVNLNLQPVPGKEQQLQDGLQIGDEFLVDVRFQDRFTEDAQGVTFGYANLLFDPNVLQVVTDDSNVDGEDGVVDGIVRNSQYNLDRKGTVRNPQGLVDEVGGGIFASPENPPQNDRVFSLHLEAVGGGNTAILGSRATEGRFSQITILGALADQRDQTNFGEINVAEGVNEQPITNVTLSQNNNIAAMETAIEAMDVSIEFQDDAGNPLEEVEVGEDFNIVLKAEDLRSEGDKLGVFSAFADIGYDTVLADVTDANLSEPFQSPVLSLEEAISEGEGVVEALGGTSANFNPAPGVREVATLTATATAAGEFQVSSNAPEQETARNTLFGVDGAVNEGTRYGENTLTITGESPQGRADLVVTEFDAKTDHVLGGETEIEVTVENKGNGNASGFQLEVLYYQADNEEELATETPTVVETLAFDELASEQAVSETQKISLPLEALLEEALADDPSIVGEEIPEEGITSNNIDFLGVRIVNSDSSNESEEAFANNGVDGTQGVNVDDITFFPWDILNNDADGVKEGEDELVADGVVTSVDANAVFGSIGQVIAEGGTEAANGLDLSRIDLDLDGAISPVDAVRVVNRIGYEINPAVFEDAVG